MFEVNDNLICINDKPLQGSFDSIENDRDPKDVIGPPVKNGENYTAGNIHICECGKQHIYVSCFDCGDKLPKTTHWCHPSRFEKA